MPSALGSPASTPLRKLESTMANQERERQIQAILTEVTPAPAQVCDICKQAYVLPVSLPCGHLYCTECIKRWLTDHESCPHDRGTVLPLPGPDSRTDMSGALNAAWHSATVHSFDDLEAQNEAERVLYGSSLNREQREPLVQQAWQNCGFDQLAENKMPANFNLFGQRDERLAICFAADEAADFLIHRPLSRVSYDVTIDPEELRPYVVAMGNLLPAYHRLISEQDREALAVLSSCAKYERLLTALLKVIWDSRGNRANDLMPELLWSWVRRDTQEIEQDMKGQGVANDVSQRLFFQLCYAVGAQMLGSDVDEESDDE